MKKINKKGFTLIELLAAIFIISLIAGIGSYSVVKVINNSREKGKEVSLSNVFKTCQLYVKEHFNSVSWIADDDNTKEYTCVSIQSLVNDGFFDKKVFNIDGINDSTLVKVTRNKTTYVYDSVNSSSISNDSNIQCNSHFINSPKCNDLTYNGEPQQLISDISGNEDKYTLKLNNVSVDSIESVSGIDANSYSINATISNTEGNQYSWANYSNSSINLTCKINKKKVFVQGNGSYTFNPNDFDGNTLKSDYKDSIISDLNNKSKGLVDGHTINDINISKSSNGRKLNYSGAQVYNNETNVSSNYNIEYNSSNLIINRGVDKPTSICKSGLIYNGSPQILADAGEGYTLSGNIGTDAGTYTVRAVLDNDLSWSDGSKDVLSYNCSIGKANLVLTIDSPINTYENNFRLENYPHDYVTLTSPQFSNQIFDLDDINIEYYYSQSSDCSNLDIEYSDTSNNITGSSKFYAKGKIYKYDDNFNDNIWSNCAEINILTPPNDSYAISYNYNGGSAGSPSDAQRTELSNQGISTYNDTKVKFDQQFVVYPAVRTGYTMSSWDISNMDTSTHYFGKDNSVSNTETTLNGKKYYYYKHLRSDNSKTVQFKANWTPITYSVSYNYDGGSAGSPTADQKTELSNKGISTWNDTSVNYNQQFYVVTPTKTGYSFGGWNISNMDNKVTHYYGGNSTTDTSLTGVKNCYFKNLRSSSGTVSYKATWAKNSYTVQFQSDVSSCKLSKTSATWNYDTAYNVANPTCTGYTFLGWKAVSGMNGSTAKYGTSSSSVNTLWKQNDTWTSNVKATYFKNLTPTSGGTAVMKAMWSPITYKVEFQTGNSNCTLSKTSATWTYDTAYNVANPTCTGYTFLGWTAVSGMSSSTAKYGTSSSSVNTLWYKNDAWTTNVKATYFKNLRVNNSDSSIMKAAWTANTYKLTYNNNGGTGCTSKTSTYNSTWGSPLCTPSRSGYTFVGWYTTVSGGTHVTSSTKVTGNKTVYAHWTKNVVITKTYVDNGGWVCAKCRDDDNKTYCALDDDGKCIQVENGAKKYGNTVAKLDVIRSGDIVKFNWESRNGGDTYVNTGYVIKFIIKNSSGTIVYEKTIKESSDKWGKGSTHKGTISCSLDSGTTTSDNCLLKDSGTYKFTTDGSSNDPSFDFNFGTIKIG